MPSYFWLTSSRLKEPVQDEDLLRVRNAWEQCQASRDRNAIYGYLSAVFDLVMWWAAEDRAVGRARWALQLQRLDLPTTDEPFAMVIFCTADRQKVDRRTRSKWSRALRYSAKYKSHSESLAASFAAKVGSTSAIYLLSWATRLKLSVELLFCMRPDESAAWCVFSSFRLVGALLHRRLK